MVEESSLRELLFVDEMLFSGLLLFSCGFEDKFRGWGNDWEPFILKCWIFQDLRFIS